MVDGMVRRMKAELSTSPRVIATGGLADLMFKVAETIEATEKNLTLEGLRLLSEALEGKGS
jgi:type III pantothenate kinase